MILTQFASLSDYSAEYRRNRRKMQEQNSNREFCRPDDARRVPKNFLQENLPREKFLLQETLATWMGPNSLTLAKKMRSTPTPPLLMPKLLREKLDRVFERARSDAKRDRTEFNHSAVNATR